MNLKFRRTRKANVLTDVGDDLQGRADGARRTAQTALDLRGVHVELGERAAQGIAVHAEFFSGFTLIASMTGENFRDVTLLEFAHCIGVGDACCVHLEDEMI